MRTIARMLLAGLLAWPTLGFTQQIPLFQFTMYFEDSIGNKDSIILGHDPSASSQNIDPQFGEMMLSDPFDSIFEVRAIHPDDSQERTLKTVIVQTDQSVTCDTILGAAKIIINAKFPPVKITYDSTLFLTGTCVNVILSPEWDIFFLQNWWDVNEYHCMTGSSSFVEDFQHPVGWNFLYTEKEVEGQGIKMLPGLFFMTFFGSGPCNNTTFLSVKEDAGIGFGALNPNPVREQFSIQVSSDSGIEAFVCDVTGRLMSCPFSTSDGLAHFDASQLMPGIYFVSLKPGESRQIVYRFVKF